MRRRPHFEQRALLWTAFVGLPASILGYFFLVVAGHVEEPARFLAYLLWPISTWFRYAYPDCLHRWFGFGVVGWFVVNFGLGFLYYYIQGLLVFWVIDKLYPRPQVFGYCKKCDYDLTGNVSGVCPECGTPIVDRNKMK